ncbi:MAG: ComEC/Rec2 family competence protein [bacterium]
MTNEFDQYRQAKKRQGGRTDTRSPLVGWGLVLILLVLNTVSWFFAIQGYQAMVNKPEATHGTTARPESSHRTSGVPVPPGRILAERDSNELALAFLDVGQGDAIFIQTPNNRNLLIDAGEGSNPDSKYSRAVEAARELIIPFFKRNKVNKLDYFITSHPHSDHIGGAYRIIKKVSIDELWAAGKNHPSRSKKDMLKAIEQKKHEYDLEFHVPGAVGGTLQEGQKLDLGPSVRGWLLRTAPQAESVNESSLSILLYFGNVGMLFTGDTERKGEKELLRQWGNQLDVEILKSGHHGSRTSTIPPFARTVDPEHTVHMVGHYNSYGHPSKEVLSRLRRLGSKNYRTDRHGTVFMFTDGRTIDVKNRPVISAVND